MTAAEPVSRRCWCGRPVLDSTGRCNQEHGWPRNESDWDEGAS